MKNKILLTILCAAILTSNIFFATASSLKVESEKYDLEIKKDKIIDIKPLDDLPSYFSWRDIDGVDFVTPIRNQTPYPSCETFAITAAVETMVQYEVGYPFGCDLSEAHLFFFSGGVIEWGSYPENDTQFLVDYGIPDEACWPYPDVQYQYPLNTTSPDWQKRTVKITDWYYLPEDPEAIKTALVTNGPVPTYFHVYKDFIYYKEGIYDHKWGESVAPHYVTIVGYNDDPGYWIVKNSWGTKYQDEGWFNIKYGECSIEKKSFYLTGVYGQFPIVYVDDDNIVGPWEGTKENPYNTIQQAIDTTYEGYTIYVKNGTYYENVVINKTINLDGESRENTIIDGNCQGHVIEVSAPNVRVSGFTIQNSGKKPFDSGIKTLTLASSINIQNNIIKNNDIGIFLNYALEEGNTIKDNLVYSNREGIYGHWANDNYIINNTVKMNTEHGLHMERCQLSKIQKNEFSNNGGCGIYLRATSDNNIINNKNIIKNNSIGIKIKESNKNSISGNNFVNNDQQAYFNQAHFTTWKRNYWDDWPHVLPKIIRGHIGQKGIIWINLDWLPKRDPY